MTSFNSSGIENTSSVMSHEVATQPDAWQVTHLIFLLLVCFLGTIGNIMTIIAVKIERKLRESLSNLFVVNLAVADLIVCATVVPMLLAHDAHAEMLFGPALCYVTVSVSGIACHTAAATMTCIALTRYIAASKTTEYHEIVTRKKIYFAIGGVWLFAAINSVPILIAWLEAGYDVTKYVCVCFDGTFPLYYTLGPVFIGHFLPHAVTIYCYACIVMAMRRSRRKFSTGNSGVTYDTSGNSITVSDVKSSKDKRKSAAFGANSESEGENQQSRRLSVRNWSKHEIQLLKTSMWVIAFFSFCWIPYGVLVLLQNLAPIELKKTFASLCLLSFSLNPVIYGLLSKSFRRAYYRIIRKAMCGFCGCQQNIASSESSASVSSTTGVSKAEKTQSFGHSYRVTEESRPQYGRNADL